MRTQALSSGLRVTLSQTELHALLNLARYGSDALDLGDVYLEPRQAAAIGDVITGLELGLASVRIKQAEAKAIREAPKLAAKQRAAREHHCIVDGFTVIAALGDWCDVSENPDHAVWADMFNPDTKPREQGEIRRNVWRIHVLRGSVATENYVLLPGACTESSDREEITVLARGMISSFVAAREAAA